MKVVYYSYPHFLDNIFPQIEALSKLVELHVVIELAPENWKSNILDNEQKNLKSGFYSASEILGQGFPKSIKKYWKACASLNFFVFDNSRSLHPNTWRQAWIITEFLRKSKADVVHFNGVSLRIAPFLWRLKKYPIVLNVHDPEPHSGEDGWRKRLSTRLARMNADHFILHSSFSKNEFISQTGVQPSCVSMIPLGVYDIFRHWIDPTYKQEQNTVLFFGRISPYKGIGIFLRAAQIVSSVIGGCRFIIAGRVVRGYTIPDLPPLKQGCFFDVRDHYLSNSEVAELMVKTSLVVCPYLDATQSGVVLTAYAFNKPVIVTNVGGLPEYVWEGKTGTIVPPNDPEKLAEAIIEYLRSNHDTLEQREENFDVLLKSDLGWGKAALATVQVYEKAISTHHPY